MENMKPMWPDMAILSNQPEVEKYGRHTARKEEPEALESEESLSPLLSNELLRKGVK